MNRIGFLITVAFVGVALGIGAGAGIGSASDQVTMEVHVVDDDNEDVAGATVTVSWDDGDDEAVTRSNGKTFVDVPVDAEVSIAVEHDDLVQNNPVEYGTVSDHTDQTVQLFPPADATVTVTENDSPADGATVTYTKVGADRVAAEGKTDSNGQFTASDIEFGTYEIEAVKPGYYAESTEIDLEQTDEIALSLERGSTSIAFQIIDGVLDEPLETTVHLEKDGVHDASMTTAADGSRSITLDVNTEYTVSIERDGYDDTDRILAVGETEEMVTYEIERAPVLTVEPANQRVIVGENVSVDVTDEYDRPVENARVLVDGIVAARTAADGSASVPIDEPGDRELTAERRSLPSTVAVVEGVDPDADDDDIATTVDDATGEEDDSGDTNDATDEGTAETDGMPGFGVLVALGSLVGGLIAHRYRSISCKCEI